jgi:hypothetical protein
MESAALAPVNRVAHLYKKEMERKDEPRPRVYWKPVVHTDMYILILCGIPFLFIRHRVTFRAVIHLNAKA